MKKILMLLTNAFMPDPRPYTEALSMLKAGYSVKILCWDRGEARPGNENIDGIRIERVYVKSTHGRGSAQIYFLGITLAKMLFRLIKENPDIVWCHDLDTLPAGLVYKVLKRKKVVFDSHEIYSKMLGSNVPSALKSFIGFFERHLSKYADLVIVTCEAMSKFYVSLGVKKITVVSNFKDPDIFHIDQNILKRQRDKLGIKGELVICYIANLGPERIIKPLLDIVKKDDELFLIAGGDGSQRAIVEQAARESPRIIYLGYVQAGMVPLYTAVSDIIYYGYNRVSGMAEFASPNKLFEALAAGKAFLGGDFGDMGRIIKEENCGIALKEFNETTMKDAIAILKDREKLLTYKNNSEKAGLGKYRWANAEAELLKAAALVSP